jgi:hypothetical protein
LQQLTALGLFDLRLTQVTVLARAASGFGDSTRHVAQIARVHEGLRRSRHEGGGNEREQ